MDRLDDDRQEIQERQRRSSSLPMVIGAAALLLLGGLSIYLIITANDDTEVKEVKKTKITESVPEYKIPAPVRPKPPVVKEPPKATIQPVTLTPVKKPVKVKSKAETLLERQLSANLGSDAKSRRSGRSGGASLKASDINKSSDGLNLTPTKTTIVQASRLPNLNYIVPKGTPIPCALNTAIQSDQSGMITCTTTEDIYSANGLVVLIDRGSAVTGEYRNASLTLGKRRLFAIWDRIRTPDGVIVQIDSPVTGPLGRSGVGGYIDNHYLERWGAAILVALIYDQFENNNDNGFDNTEDQVQDLSTEFLNQYRRIKPTLHRHQGGEVAILVARDLDFSTVYGLSDAH